LNIKSEINARVSSDKNGARVPMIYEKDGIYTQINLDLFY